MISFEVLVDGKKKTKDLTELSAMERNTILANLSNPELIGIINLLCTLYHNIPTESKWHK